MIKSIMYFRHRRPPKKRAGTNIWNKKWVYTL